MNAVRMANIMKIVLIVIILVTMIRVGVGRSNLMKNTGDKNIQSAP
jgi:hypothetical protein